VRMSYPSKVEMSPFEGRRGDGWGGRIGSESAG
jgi:hypothetical protein